MILSAWNSQIEGINSSNGKPQNLIGRANILKCNAQFKVTSIASYFCVMFSEHLWNTAEFSWDRPRSKMEGQGFGCSIQHPKSMLSSGLVSNYCLLAENKALKMFTIKTMQGFFLEKREIKLKIEYKTTFEEFCKCNVGLHVCKLQWANSDFMYLHCQSELKILN